MFYSMLKATALAVIALASLSAQAALTNTAPACNSADLNPNSFACGGSFAGNNTNQEADVLSFISTTWGLGAAFAGSSDSAAFGPFTSNPQTTTGTLTFDTAQDGPFVLSLKAGNQFSLYFYNGAGAAIPSITYSTVGTNLNPQGRAQDLSHASLYSVTAVPEPETYALMMAGLGAMGFMARRRKR